MISPEPEVVTPNAAKTTGRDPIKWMIQFNFITAETGPGNRSWLGIEHALVVSTWILLVILKDFARYFQTFMGRITHTWDMIPVSEPHNSKKPIIIMIHLLKQEYH
jgi:hypothetical protein